MKPFIAFVLWSVLIVASAQSMAKNSGDEDLLEAPLREPLIERLKLTDRQKKQFEQMRIDMQKQLVGIRSKMQLARLDMRQLVIAENPDKAAIEKKMNEMIQLLSQMGSVRLNHWFEVNKMLNPDQQKVWKEVLKHPFRERVRAFVGRRMMRGWGPMMQGRMGSGQFPPEVRERIRECFREFIWPEKK